MPDDKAAASGGDETSAIDEDEDGGMDWGSFHSMDEWAAQDDTPPPDQHQLPTDFSKDFSAKFEDGANDNYVYPASYLTSWHLEDELVEKLHNGAALFGFTCKLGSQLEANEQQLLNIVINKTRFADEERDNGCPRIDATALTEAQEGMTFLIARTMYVLPNVSLAAINLRDFTSPEYHKNCQPSGTTIWDDCLSRGDKDTFRITKPIIPYIFKMTVQFKCSMYEQDELQELSPLFGGLRVDKALLLERTKRNIQSQDMTKKCKSVVLFHKLPGERGVLSSTVSFIINSSVPKIFASIIDRVGSLGTAECSDTATKTRKYLAKVTRGLPDPFPPTPQLLPRAVEPEQEPRTPTGAGAQAPAAPVTPVTPIATEAPAQIALTPAATAEALKGAVCAQCLKHNASAVIRRSRIRPPGCTDESQYAVRSRVAAM